MTGRVLRIALLTTLLLTLSACFRPAGEAIEPSPLPENPVVNPTNTPEQDEATEAVSDIEAAADVETDEAPVEALDVEAEATEEESNFPPITVIQPTRSITTTEAAPDDENVIGSTALPGTTPTYITPGVPLGPIETAVPTSTPPGSAFTATPSGLVTPTDLFEASNSNCVYTVQAGDNLFRISQRNNISLDELRAANPDLTGDAPIIHPGDQINLPGCGTPQAPSLNATAVPTSVSAPVGGEVYTVRSGDTLFTISQTFGVSISDIVAANNLADPDRLEVGQELIIPPPSE